MLAAPNSALAADQIVFLDDEASAATVAASVGSTTKLEVTNVANAFSADLSSGQVDQLLDDPAVIDVQPDTVFALMPFKRAPFKRAPFKRAPFKRGDVGAPWSTQITPTGVARITAGRLRSGPINADIAILDGGIDAAHPDLNVAGAISCVPGAGPEDVDGHGTMVAGLAAASDNGYGIIGAAPGARIWSIKVADADGVIMESAALCAMEWVLARTDTIDVVNMSWAGEFAPSETSCASATSRFQNRTSWWRTNRNPRSRLTARQLRLMPFKRGTRSGSTPTPEGPADGDDATIDALQALTCKVYDQGVTLVAAAGNDGKDAAGYLPAAWPQVMAVSSMADTDGRRGGRGPAGCVTGDRDDYMSSYSNYGKVIAIAAPGECLLSTDIDDNYAVGSGTSFAAPLVSGAAARLTAQFPRSGPRQIRTLLLATAERGPIPGDPDRYKEGLLRMLR
ncbi:MAG: S8 family serine peptidase [Gaiellales bacterium]